MKHLPVVLLFSLAFVSAPARAQESPARDPAPVRQTPFPDVPREHWAYDAVEQLRKAGILRGYPPDPAPPRRARRTRTAAAGPASRK